MHKANVTKDESPRFSRISTQSTNHFVDNCHYFPEHEGPVSMVSVSSDSLLVLAATSTGNLGFLDVRSRGYSTLMRSHTDTVLSFSVDGIRRHLTTASCDGTVRIWNMDSLHQVIKHHNYRFNCLYIIAIIMLFPINKYPFCFRNLQKMIVPFYRQWYISLIFIVV